MADPGELRLAARDEGAIRLARRGHEAAGVFGGFVLAIASITFQRKISFGPRPGVVARSSNRPIVGVVGRSTLALAAEHLRSGDLFVLGGTVRAGVAR